jgi:hypothetical protein
VIKGVPAVLLSSLVFAATVLRGLDPAEVLGLVELAAVPGFITHLTRGSSRGHDDGRTRY